MAASQSNRTKPRPGSSWSPPEITRRGRPVLGLVLFLAAPFGGCAVGAKVDLAAADAIDASVANLRTSIEEFRADLDSGDDTREADVVAAFVARIQTASESDVSRHTVEFLAALDRLRGDRDVSHARYRLSLETLDSLHETAAGLRHMAVQALSLDEDVSRQIESLLTRGTPQKPKEKP